MIIAGKTVTQIPEMPVPFSQGQARLDSTRLAPWSVVAVGMAAAFLAFLLLDILEQWLFPGAPAKILRVLHLIRGFLATSGGMSVVYWVMRRKEVELVELRDHFAEQLALRTEELCHSNENLSREIECRKEVQEKLRRSIERLAQSNSALQQFAKIASHDLQEPLRVITGYAGLLTRRYKGKLDENADQFLKAIVDGTQRMEDLIEDILAHADCKDRQTAFETVDSSKIVDEAIANLSVAVRESGASISRDELPLVMCDGRQLVQLFQNLLSNAIKFRGAESPEIQISARHEAKDWIFSVSDKGIGIEPQYQEQVFEMFKRLHGRKAYPGTGIGLAICKNIVENHHGKIWLESAPAKGSTFFFSIPDNSSIGAT